MKPRNGSSTFAKVRFPDHQKLKNELAALATQAMQQDPSIQAVYLFGSRATGDVSAHSDADLLIVVADNLQRPVDRIPRYLRLFRKAPVPVDVFSYTTQEIQKNAFARRAMEQGELLSARH